MKRANYKIEVRQQKTEESEPKEKDEMERTGESLEVPAALSWSRERFMRRWWKRSVIVISLLSLPPKLISFLSHRTLSFPSSLLIWIILMGA